MMKRMIALLLMAVLLLTGCQVGGEQPGSNDATTAPTEAQPLYDWMAAESPIPVRRSGLLRAGLNSVPFDVTNEGFYYIANPVGSDTNSYILYAVEQTAPMIRRTVMPMLVHVVTQFPAGTDTYMR